MLTLFPKDTSIPLKPAEEPPALEESSAAEAIEAPATVEIAAIEVSEIPLVANESPTAVAEPEVHAELPAEISPLALDREDSTSDSDVPAAPQENVMPAAVSEEHQVEASSPEISLAEANVFDEMEVLQEAAPASAAGAETLDQEAAAAEPARRRKSEGPRPGFFVLERVPEVEAMEDADSVEAYASAAAQAHLDAIDDTFVAHAQLLLKGKERGRALDIGTGPGQIVIKLGYRLTRWKFVGVDRSPAMIEKARASLSTASELAGRVEFRVADGNALDFPDATFDLVTCNSVLHHVPEPQLLFAEIARLVKPSGAILMRDLVRPSKMGFSMHVRKHGKHYEGEMRKLFEDSVRAAYTEEELTKMLAVSKLRGVRVFRHGKAHIGFERPFSGALR